MAREISHEVPKPAVRKLVTDVVEPDISVEILTVHQEVNSVIDVGWKDIFKSSAGHRPQCDASSTADAEDSVQHEIKGGRKD